MAKVVPIRAKIEQPEPNTGAEQALFELTDLEVGTIMVYRGKRHYDGATFTVVQVRTLGPRGGRLRKVAAAKNHHDQVTLQRIDTVEPERTTQAGYLRQSAHWRKL